MSDEERAAFEAARALIAKVKRQGGTEISFDTTDFRALTRIPEEIDRIEGLKSLDLDSTKITDLDPISGLRGLRVLSLNQTNVSDLSAILGLKGLQNLRLRQTGITELGPIAAARGLSELFLDQTGVSDLTPLANLKKLRILRLSHTPVQDLAPISNLTRLQNLYLIQTGVSDLIPIEKLVGMQRLYLNQSPVSDLVPIRGLTNLRGIFIEKTQVLDLRPLANLDQLGTGSYGGLLFSGSPASRLNTTLRRLAKSQDRVQCARETLAYLKTLPPWPEPLPWLEEKAPAPLPNTPEQDPALPLIWGEKGFTFFADSINSDPVTEAALADLRALLEDLRRKGNRHDDLYRLAGELQERSAGPVRDLNMVSLHLSYQKLRRLYQARGTRAEGFDDETVGVMGSVLEIVPGVTLADPGVEQLIARQEKDRLAGATPESAKAENAILDAIQDPDAPFAPEVKDIAAAIQQPGEYDRLTGTRRLLSRNSVIVVVTYVALRATEGAISGPVGNYVYEHGREILALAQTMGTDVFLWAQMTLASFKAEYQIAMGIAKEGLTSGPSPSAAASATQSNPTKKPPTREALSENWRGGRGSNPRPPA